MGDCNKTNNENPNIELFMTILVNIGNILSVIYNIPQMICRHIFCGCAFHLESFGPFIVFIIECGMLSFHGRRQLYRQHKYCIINIIHHLWRRLC